jgi:RND family efflux transporter MFP subunit
LIAAATLSLLAPRHTAAQRPAPLIAAAPVVEREVAAAQTFVATVRPTRMVTIGSAASGRVFKYDLEEGDRVEEMQPIAELLTETISSEIKAAEADWKLRQSELEELVNGTRPEELDQARARMQAAEARLEYATTHRDRVEQLFRQGGSSVAERDEAVTLYTAAMNEFAEAKAAYDLAELGPRKEKIAQAEAAAEMQAAVVEKLTDQKRKHTVIARFNGFITKKLTEVGAWVNTGDPVAEVAELDSVDVEAFVTEKQVPNIFVGMSVDVVVPALGAEPFEGVVHQIIPQADVRTRTFPVRVRVKNQISDGTPRIKAGMLARAKLPIGPPQQSKLVPKDALVFRGENTSLLAITPDENDPKKGTVRPVPVELGVSQGQQIQVIGGVEAGELVVVEGNERLRPGQNVVIDAVRNVDSEAAATKSAKR